jgi:hypothetical protein
MDLATSASTAAVPEVVMVKQTVEFKGHSNSATSFLSGSAQFSSGKQRFHVAST